MQQLTLKHRMLRGVGHLHWLRGRDRILRAFADPETQTPWKFEVDFFGRRYSGDLADFMDWTVFYYGAYCRNELFLLAEIARRLKATGQPLNFFDVGANLGQHSMFMADHAERIFAFEPFSVVRNEMQRKLSHAKVDNVTIFPLALGDCNSVFPFYRPSGVNRGTGTLRPSHEGSGRIAATDTVEVACGDEFFAANNLPPVSLLKIDVEGFESRVLDGLRNTLKRDRPPFIMEISGPDKSGFLTKEGLASRLYEDHVLFEVGEKWGQCALRPFSFDKTAEVLVLPSELSDLAERFL